MTKKNGKHDNNRKILLAVASLALQTKKKLNKLQENLRTFKGAKIFLSNRQMFDLKTKKELVGNFIQWYGTYNELAVEGVLSEDANLNYGQTIIGLKTQNYVNNSGFTGSQERMWEITSYDGLPDEDNTTERKPFYFIITYYDDKTRDVIAYNVNDQKLDTYSFKYDLNIPVQKFQQYLNSRFF